jgi:protoheme IX farnesyltransferase
MAYGLVATALGIGFVWHGWKLLVAGDQGMKSAKALFSFSILYLFAIFATLLVDTIVARALASG